MRKLETYVNEKLKVSKNNFNTLKIELRNFITWYMFDNKYWTASDLKSVKFAEGTVNKYFDWSYRQLYDFINKHSKDVIYVSEEKINDTQRYVYSFTIDDIPFNLEAHIEDTSELLSNQFRILIEKLRVTNTPIKGTIKSTMKEFFLWYWGSETTNDDFWEAMSVVKFENDVIKENFNNMNEFLDWFETHMNDIVYFDEVKIDKETYKYTFSCDGIEFVIDAWLSTKETPFSKS